MPFSAILGQAPAVDTLTRALRRGRVHHAYRFEGPQGVGKELAAVGLAQSLLCETPLDGLACRQCSACRRVVKRSEQAPNLPQHPDFLLVQRGLYAGKTLGPSVSDEKETINAPQVRKIVLERVGYPPHEGRARVFLIRDADELNVTAANALLKTLEEPPQGTHFILLTSRPNRLLDTIRSRTFAIRFAPLPDDILRTILDRSGASHATIALAGGSAARALEYADEALLAERDEFIGLFDQALAAPDLARAIAAVDVKANQRGTLREQLGGLAAELALRARASVAGEPELAERQAAQFRQVLGAMTELERNGNNQLVIEALVTRLRRA